MAYAGYPVASCVVDVELAKCSNNRDPASNPTLKYLSPEHLNIIYLYPPTYATLNINGRY
jgi:hypothetical protein